MLFEKIASLTLTEIARLVSPDLSLNGSECELEFYYYKADVNITSLGVYAISAQSTQRLWLTNDASNENQWKKAVIRINRSTNKFNIIFEGVLLVPNENTQLAIDDISFLNCQAHASSTTASTIKTETSTISSNCPVNVCNNGGSCIYSQQAGVCTCKCVCNSQYTGTYCENAKNKEKKCKN